MTRDEALVLYNSGEAAAIDALCDLSDTVEAQRKKIKSLELKIAKLSKNSSNSSKSPSSDDITKKKKKGEIGGHPGHERNVREPFAEDEIDFFHPCIPTGCPVCDGRVDLLDMPPEIIRQMELVEVPVVKVWPTDSASMARNTSRVRHNPRNRSRRQCGATGGAIHRHRPPRHPRYAQPQRTEKQRTYMDGDRNLRIARPVGIQFYIASSYRLLQRYSRAVAYTRYIVGRWQTDAIETAV